MAECHPVGFQWVMEAKARGAKVIHVDPRYTRTSALADQHVPLRVGSDIAFLGGIIRYVLEHELDFREYVVAYTNAATLVSEDFVDTEELDGLFSGYDPETATYDTCSWAYEGRCRRRPPGSGGPAAGATTTTSPRSRRASARPGTSSAATARPWRAPRSSATRRCSTPAASSRC